jgi:hypothetical protein
MFLQVICLHKNNVLGKFIGSIIYMFSYIIKLLNLIYYNKGVSTHY